MESDYEDSRTMEVNVIEEQAYRSRITPRSYPTPYQNRTSHIPNSTYALTSPAMQHQQIPRQPLSAHRGMMERFMDDRDPVLQSFESQPLSTMELAPVYEQHHPRTRHFSPAPTVLRSNEGVQHSSIFNHAPTSPRPSRPPQADLLCSPDVARLLRSELDELAAAKSNKKGSIQADNDIVRSSPSQITNAILTDSPTAC